MKAIGMRAMAAMAAFRLLGLAGTALAAEYGWDAGGDGSNWSSANNWKPDGNPGASDTLHFNDANQTENIVVNTNATIHTLRAAWDTVVYVNQYHTVNWTDDGNGRTVTVTNAVEIMKGSNGGGSGGDNYWGGARVNLTNLHLVIGAPNARATIAIGWGTDAGGNLGKTGSLTVSGGSVRAYLSSLVLGRNDALSKGHASGLLDLLTCDNLMIDISGGMFLGDADASSSTGGGNYAGGTFRGGGGTVNVGGDLRLSDNKSNLGSNGRVFLSNTVVTVAGQALFYGYASGDTWARRFAQANVTVAGTCSGLNLTNANANALSFPNGKQNDATIGNYNLIEITFSGDPVEPDSDRWYWGLRRKGDHVSALDGYKDETYPRLKILNSATTPMAAEYWSLVDIVYSDPTAGGTGYTYVGFRVPPPAGTVLVFQ